MKKQRLRKEGDDLPQYLAALVLLGHGIRHIIGLLASWTSVKPDFTDKPWVMPGAHAVDSGVGKVWGLIWLAAMAAFISSGIGVLMNEDWWRTLAAIGSVISIIAIVPWWVTSSWGRRPVWHWPLP